MKKTLVLFLAALMVLNAFAAVPAFAWNATATFPNGPTGLARGNAQDVLPLRDNPHFKDNWQDHESPFAFDLSKQATGKINGRLPMMGFNTWNQFGSGINETIIKDIADSFIRLELDKLGYNIVGIDDGSYNRSNQRGPDGELIPDNTRFPSGFKSLADYVKGLGLKLAMYNDVGTQTCNGLCSSSWGREDLDAMSYAEWGVEYIKHDYCNNPWPSAPNVAAPNIRSIRVTGDGDFSVVKNAVNDGVITPGRVSNPGIAITGNMSASKNVAGDYVSGLTVNTGVNGTTGDLNFTINVATAGTYGLSVEYVAATDATNRWLQAEVNGVRVFDNKLPNTGSATNWTYCAPIQVTLNAGDNAVRLFNEKRREIGMEQYYSFFDGFQKAKEEHPEWDIIYSLCEWGNTQPWLWAWKLGNSWRTTADIQSGWQSMAGIYSQNVILDDYAGLDRGWNDADMLEVGVNNTGSEFLSANFKENESHFNLWAIMNSPLLLGADLRNVVLGDPVWEVIANKDIIALNQDPLGVQAKRVKMEMFNGNNADPRVYTGDFNRLDYLVKPCANGDLALMMANLSNFISAKGSITLNELINGDSEYGVGIGAKMVNKTAFENAVYFRVSDLGARSKGSWIIGKDTPITADLVGRQSMTVRISMVTEYAVDFYMEPRPDDETVAAVYTIVDPSNTPINANLILAVYDADGIMRGVKIDEVANAIGGYRNTLVSDVVVPTSTVRCFIWDGSFAPLLAAKEYEKPVAEKAELVRIIDEANAIAVDKDLYTQASYDNLLTALNAAILLNGASNPYQSSVNDAVAAVDAAIKGLVFTPRTNLGLLLAKARALNPAQFESVSAAALTTAIADAQAAYDDAQSSDPELEGLITALQAALDGLSINSSINFSSNVQIVNAYRSSRSIETNSGYSNEGANVDMWSLQSGVYDKWRMYSDSNGIYFRFAKIIYGSGSPANTMLVPTDGILEDDNVLTISGLAGAADYQWWMLEKQTDGPYPGTYIISNKADSNYVIAIRGDSNSTGSKVVVAKRGTMQSQYWTLPPLFTIAVP